MKSTHNASPFTAWLNAFRLRTLPLSLSTITLGNALAYFYCKDLIEVSSSGGASATFFSWKVFGLALLTTLLLQILSNLANDYGDSQKGADNENRIGPARAVQSGLITPQAMKNGIIVSAVLSLISGIALLYFAMEGNITIPFVIMFLLGLASIGAAIKYTVGKSAYGYRGMGDVFVFLFFGLLGVGGSFYLQIGNLAELVGILFPAIAMGLLCTGVLNLNNMRDIENDLAVGKVTLAASMGLAKAKNYHRFLILGAIFCSLVFSYFAFNFIRPSYALGLWFLSVPLLAMHLRKVISITENKLFDPLLKQLALSSALWAVLMSLGLVLSFVLEI